MNSKQILSIEQMQHLQELGLDTSNASASWYKPDMDTEYMLMFGHMAKEELVGNEESIPAYTLQDVLDALPKEIEIDNRKYSLIIEKDAVMYVNWIGEAQMGWIWGEGKCINKFIPLIDYAYSMLVECIENGYVETNKNE